jgi:hypothetical protein
VDGFDELWADLPTQEVQVRYDPSRTEPAALLKAIRTGTDFNANPWKAPEAAGQKAAR